MDRQQPTVSPANLGAPTQLGAEALGAGVIGAEGSWENHQLQQ